jgi:hypothetical protein
MAAGFFMRGFVVVGSLRSPTTKRAWLYLVQT